MAQNPKMVYTQPQLHSLSRPSWELACASGSGAGSDGTCDDGDTVGTYCYAGTSAVETTGGSGSDRWACYSTGTNAAAVGVNVDSTNFGCDAGNIASTANAKTNTPCTGGTSPTYDGCASGT